MHRILYITDPTDPLTGKVHSVADGKLKIETVSGANVSVSFSDFDAVLVGDSRLATPIIGTGENGPKLVQLTRGHHRDVDSYALIASGTTVSGSSPVLAPYVARHALKLVQSVGGESGGEQHHSLNGKTVGIVGFGRVGRAMAELCKVLGATVIYSDVRTAPHGSATAIGARRSTLDLLLSKADIVSLHVQWGSTSNPLISERELRLMGRESVLVNTADSRLVDSEALSVALESGRVRAALDIEEVIESPLANAPGTETTPYIAARSSEADENVAEFVISNILSALSGGEPTSAPDGLPDGLIEIVDFPRAGDPAFWSSKMSPRVL